MKGGDLGPAMLTVQSARLVEQEFGLHAARLRNGQGLPALARPARASRPDLNSLACVLEPLWKTASGIGFIPVEVLSEKAKL
jgi:hypothetical protein